MTRVGILLIVAALVAWMVGYVALHPIEIRDWCDLDAIRDNLGGSYILMNDLDSTTAGYEEMASPIANQEKGWQPIGTLEAKFTGSFNGQGFEIRDLFIDRPDGWGVGLFGWLGEAGVIKNIGIVNITVIGGHGVGGLAGYTSECNECTVSNSYSTGNVTGHSPVGGLISCTWHGPVSNSYSTCSVTGDAFVGGLIGENACSVSNSYATGSVSGDEHVGGLIGESMGNVSNSYSTGNVTGQAVVGGLVGENSVYEGGIVSNSYSTGSVSGNEDVGGLVGFNDGTVRNSFWDTETSRQATSDSGIGKTTAEMKNITLFSGAGWNIIAVADPSTHNSSYIWNIVNGVTYPLLSWESVA